MPEAERHTGRENTGDLLYCYYRDLEATPPMTQEEERSFWADVDTVTGRIRDHLASFCFILKKHGELLEQATDPELTGLFPPSSFPDKNTEHLKSRLAPWIREITALAEKITAVSKADGCDSASLIPLRQDAAALLRQHPVKQNILMKWVADVRFYAVHYLNSNAKSRRIIEENFCVTPEIFRAAMEELETESRKLDKLRQKIIASNLRLVVRIANQCNKVKDLAADIIQEGNLGLIRAVNTFDYKLGYRLATYATWWIRQAVIKAIASQNRIIRLPAHMISMIVKIGNAEQDFLQRHGRSPAENELAELLKMPKERIRAIRRTASQPVSLQAPAFPGEQEPHRLDQLLTGQPQENSLSPLHRMTSEHLMVRLKKTIAGLSEREQLIIRMRYGLDNTPPHTLQEVSEIFHLTRERIRQIERCAISKLRDPSLRICYQDYFFND